MAARISKDLNISSRQTLLGSYYIKVMPLDLADPLWEELETSYESVSDLLKFLTTAYSDGVTMKLLGNIINEVGHQGDTTSAMYATAPHLLDLAERNPKLKIEILIFAGIIFADSTKSNAVGCPKFLEDDFKQAAIRGARMMLPLLIEAKDVVEYKVAAGALAGFLGYHKLGRLLIHLDYYQGEFYHESSDDPLRED